MRARGEQVLDEIHVLLRGPLAGCHADHAFAAPALGAVGTDVRPLDQPRMREGDDDALVRNQVFNRNLPLVRHQFRYPRRGVLRLDGLQLRFDDAQHPFLLREDIQQA